MGLLDKTKSLGKKTVDLGKRGVEGTRDAVRKKECSECTHYTPVDATQGDCLIGNRRMASANASTCPQKAFEFKPEPAPAAQPAQQ